MPHPEGDADARLRALIFDSAFDTYRGVITYVRVHEGTLPSNAKIRMFATGVTSDAEETGVMAPEATPVESLGAGEVGYLVTGLKDVHQAKVGDTITLAGKLRRDRAAPRLPRAQADGLVGAVSRPTATTTRSCATPSTS